MVDEGKTIARASLQVVLDAAGSAARSMAVVVTMRRKSCL